MEKYTIETLKQINRNIILKSALEYIVQNNSSIHAPYHNIIHIMNMCHSITEIYINQGDIKEEEYNNLLLAALFHDVNHSQGVDTDKHNVIIAINTFIEFTNTLDSENVCDEQAIILLIKTTQYPYTVDVITMSQKIIRDADLMQSIKLDTLFGHNVCGLKTEIGKDLQWDDFLKRNSSFLLNVEMLTPYMINKYNNTKQQIQEYIIELEKLFNV